MGLAPAPERIPHPVAKRAEKISIKIKIGIRRPFFAVMLSTSLVSWTEPGAIWFNSIYCIMREKGRDRGSEKGFLNEIRPFAGPFAGWGSHSLCSEKLNAFG
jgi:hypothetical protein